MADFSSDHITAEKVNRFNIAFPRLARKYQVIHRDNCHHWDYLFILWHRRFINQFWDEIGLDRFYFIPFESEDVELYKMLTHSVNTQGRGYRDNTKMRRWSSGDADALVAHLVQAFACETFDLAFGDNERNRSRNGLYNISFSSQLEEAHDIVHGATGAGMQRVGTAGGDATFFVHHTFVDLCFEYWKQRSKKLLPITADHFDSSPQLQQSFRSFEEINRLWNQSLYAVEDFRRLEEMLDGQVPSTMLLRIGRITHIREFRSVIMLVRRRLGGTEQQVEVGRFAVITGTIANCESCRERQEHASSFALTSVPPGLRLEQIRWIIDGQRFDTFRSARNKLESIGMSQLELISFSLNPVDSSRRLV